MPHSARYTFGFVALVCGVGSLIVSTAAVTLRDRQETNRVLNERRNVLRVAGLAGGRERLSAEEVNRRFESAIRPRLVVLATGAPVPNPDAAAFDPRRAARDPATSEPAPDNQAGITRLPREALVYEVLDADTVRAVILPVRGLGLWSTMHGFLALQADLRTVAGLTFYEHGETPGLGGEIDNPAWKARWVGRRVFDESWVPQLEVIKGRAGDPAEDPFRVDGIAGATLTGRGVTNLVHFWLGDDGFGPYLARYREERDRP